MACHNLPSSEQTNVWYAGLPLATSVPPFHLGKSKSPCNTKAFCETKTLQPLPLLWRTLCLYYRWYSCAASVGCFFLQFAQHSSSPWVSCSHQFLRIQAIIASLLLMCMHGTTKISGVCSKVITMYWELLLAKGITAYYALPYHWKMF